MLNAAFQKNVVQRFEELETSWKQKDSPLYTFSFLSKSQMHSLESPSPFKSANFTHPVTVFNPIYRILYEMGLVYRNFRAKTECESLVVADSYPELHSC